MAEPLTARCDHCGQTRVLFLYTPLHNAHFTAAMATCRWCNRDTQPLLCTRCWSQERLAEENDPGLAQEGDVMEAICAANRRYAQQQRDLDTCEAIARATEEATE